jgi:hypothetical protein
MISFSLTKGFSCMDIPSPSMTLNESDSITPPAFVVHLISRPSRCLTTIEVSQRASWSDLLAHDQTQKAFALEARLRPLRLKTACGFWLSTKMPSPGCIPGLWSASPVNLIFVLWLSSPLPVPPAPFSSSHCSPPLHTPHRPIASAGASLTRAAES